MPLAVETFLLLTMCRKRHYLEPLKDLTLDWRPLLRELKLFVLPSEPGVIQTSNIRRNIRTLTKMASFAQLYFDPADSVAFLNEVLPHFSTSFADSAFIVTGLINLLFPTTLSTSENVDLLPQRYLPTFFHLWSLVNRSRVFDTTFLDLFSRLAREALSTPHVPFSEYGMYTRDQSSLIFTAILRLLGIPVGQANSPYCSTIDLSAGLGVAIERDPKKYPTSHHISRWIIFSLSPTCLTESDSILTKLEGLIQAIETFFHPSNHGSWTKNLFQMVYYLADWFVSRWNKERSGEMEVPEERRLNDELKRRFVLCLREVVFLGIYSKSGTSMNLALSSLQQLAFLEPDLILPGALQRIYPSMQGQVEVHRTTSSLRSLYHLSGTMARTKGFRCHVTTMLGLALPGIDANDLDKTMYTLSYIQSVCYNIPLYDMMAEQEEVSGNRLAMEWITSEVDRMEQEGASIELDYSKLDDKEEELILRSSTAGLAEFVSSFLGKVFTLLENLPYVAKVRSDSPEENIINTLPATFLPLLSSLSPELYNLALNKTAEFVTNHVIHQARDAMAFICSTLCKANPEKSLNRLIPVLIQAIRTEIDENGAASTRNTGADVLPRDRALVWNISMLSMCVVHVGDAVIPHKQALLDIAVYMQKRCKGNPTVHVSNYVHHLLLNLTGIYPIDNSLYEDDVLSRGICPSDWGMIPDPKKLNIKWHVPSKTEIEFAVDLFRIEGESALEQLEALIDGSSSIKRDGSNKVWSDEVARNLVLIRLLLSGVAVIFDPKSESKQNSESGSESSTDIEIVEANGYTPNESSDDVEASPERIANESEEDEARPTFKYPTGYLLEENDPLYDSVHYLRSRMGKTLHSVHRFLMENQPDDVACFNPLYSAYKCWFIDMGFERSAHVLDRVTRLLAADIAPFKVAGLRKHYPRSLLVRRAHVYHLARLRHNSTPRPKSDLSKQLLFDLAHAAVSPYTEVRRSAQSAGEAALKAIIGARPMLIPILLSAFEAGIREHDYSKIKGAIYSLIFGSLARTIGKDWRHTPRLIRAYLAASDVDKPSIQKLCGSATIQVMDFGRPSERMVILDQNIIESIAPKDNVQPKIDKQRDKVTKKRGIAKEKKISLCEELVAITTQSHWKKAARTGTIVLSLGLRFDDVSSDSVTKLFTEGAIDLHPSLRGLYSGGLVAMFSVIEARASAQHKYENYLLDKNHLPAKIQVTTRRNDSDWTADFLSNFAKPEAEYYVDHDHPGWLVWEELMPAYKPNPEIDVEYDEVEQGALRRIGQIVDKAWFSKFFEYLKQEPRDEAADRFRVSSAILLVSTFKLVHAGFSSAKLSDIKDMVSEIYGNGTDKHQHRATAETLGALLVSTNDKSLELRTSVWEYVFPIVQGIFQDGLTPENLNYWIMFVHLVVSGKDPRRSWPLVDWLASFRLDMSSNAAFKESSKIKLLQQCIIDLGWHFRLASPIMEDFLAHLDHPYKGVREAIGLSLSSIYRTRYHESYKDVNTLMEYQEKSSSVGLRPYQADDSFSRTMNSIFDRLEKWRMERPPGQQTSSPYTSGSKTVLLWLDTTLSSLDCIGLTEFFPSLFINQLLQMMDIREDTELASLAYQVFRHLANIPHAIGEDRAFIEALIKVGRTSPSWHQRLRSMVNIQVIYFRRLFLLSPEQQGDLFDCIACMLEDTQLEVRQGAATTLSGMIRCSPLALRTRVVEDLKTKFTKMLLDSPLPKKPRNNASATSTGTSTPTPEHAKIISTRHAAVLGLGALVQAFPYSSPPPKWIPGILATLARNANNDPGVVGQSVKSILSDFKKTRQDTWHVDVKVRTLFHCG